MSIQNKLGTLFIVFFLLVAISVGATYMALTRQSEDALVVNLAGRQRMLLQAMTRYALELEKHPDRTRARSELAAAVTTFETTLDALEKGGPAPYTEGTTVTLPPARDETARLRLQWVRTLWETLRPDIEVILEPDSMNTPAFGRAVTNVESQSDLLVGAMDGAVRAFEHAAAGKVRRVIFIQVGFLVLAALLVLVGYALTYRHIITPIQQLQGVARDIGQGQLDTPVPAFGEDEIGQLARSLEEMRHQLRLAREDLEFQVAQRTRELEALYEVSRDITSHLEVQQVLRSVTEKARQLLDADVAVLCMLDENGRTLQLQALAGERASVRAQASPKEEPLAATILAQDGALKCTTCKGWCHILDRRFQADHLAASLRSGERIIGALCVGSKRSQRFAPEALSLLTRLANSAAIALENAHLYEQAERVAALEERQRIAADMHDSVAQTLSYLALKVEQIAQQVSYGERERALQDLDRLRDQLDRTLEEVRQIIADLQRPAHTRSTFQDLLKRLLVKLQGESSCPITLDVCTTQPVHLTPNVTEQVLRVAQEAVRNAVHHAAAGSIHVRFECRERQGILVIEDDGRGFDLDAASDKGGKHFGLKVMRARAARIHGTLQVDSRPGRGTRVRLTFPLQEALPTPVGAETTAVFAGGSP